MTSNFSPGDVIDFFFPYAKPINGEYGKYRPALIININDKTALALALKITKSEPTEFFPNRIKIKNWRFANLIEPSYVEVDMKAHFDLRDSNQFKYRGTLWPTDFSDILKEYAPRSERAK